MHRATPSVNGVKAIALSLNLDDPVILAYLGAFPEADQPGRAVAALKMGVTVLQLAGQTIDTDIVKEAFADLEEGIGKSLAQYFKDKDGILPRSLEGVFGHKGQLTQVFHGFFDPADGKLNRLIEAQIGPSSRFGKSLDPKSKDGIICLLEQKVRELVEAKIDELLSEFSLDDEESAMSRFKAMLASGLNEIKQALGVKDAQKTEAARGHVKGFDFQDRLYQRVALWGEELGDETEFVAGQPGTVARAKVGDHLITLGESSGAPGLQLVIEVKDQEVKFKDACDELQRAKKNREAVSGIFVFSKGCEPPELPDFRRVGEDFYCTVDKDCLEAEGPLLFLESAYKMARMQAVAAARKEAEGELDLEAIHNHLDHLAQQVVRMGEIATKATTVKKNGEFIEETVKKMQEDMQERLNEIQSLLRLDNDGPSRRED